MQQSQPQPNTSNQLHSTNQSHPNPSPGMASQLTFGTPFNSPLVHKIIYSRSPLSEGIQISPWPSSYKPITLPKFNGRSDPRQFIMGFKAAIASTGGNDTILAKLFVIAAEGDALAWYSMLRQSLVYSWEDL